MVVEHRKKGDNDETLDKKEKEQKRTVKKRRG